MSEKAHGVLIKNKTVQVFIENLPVSVIWWKKSGYKCIVTRHN